MRTPFYGRARRSARVSGGGSWPLRAETQLKIALAEVVTAADDACETRRELAFRGAQTRFVQVAIGLWTAIGADWCRLVFSEESGTQVLQLRQARRRRQAQRRGAAPAVQKPDARQNRHCKNPVAHSAEMANLHQSASIWILSRTKREIGVDHLARALGVARAAQIAAVFFAPRPNSGRIPTWWSISRKSCRPADPILFLLHQLLQNRP